PLPALRHGQTRGGRRRRTPPARDPASAIKVRLPASAALISSFPLKLLVSVANQVHLDREVDARLRIGPCGAKLASRGGGGGRDGGLVWSVPALVHVCGAHVCGG